MRGVLGLLVGLTGVIGLSGQAAAQEKNGLPGIDTARGGKGSITLRLLQEPTGRRTRVLTGATGFQIRLAGRAEGDLAEGTITDGQARGLCAAKRDGDHLVLVLAAAGKGGQPDPAWALTLVPDCGDSLAASPGASEATPSSGEAPGAIGGAAPPAAEPTRPQASPVELSPAAREWDQRLRRERLTLLGRLERRGRLPQSARPLPGHERTVLFLRRQLGLGVRARRDGGSAGRNEDAGAWQIVTEGDVARIELRSCSGAVSRYVLSRVDGKTFLNRTRTFVTAENDHCP